MKFFVKIGGKQLPVSLANPPKNGVTLDSFEKINGSAYIGAPDLFVGLKKDGARYKAFTVKSVSKPIEENNVAVAVEDAPEFEQEPCIEAVAEKAFEIPVSIEVREEVDEVNFVAEPIENNEPEQEQVDQGDEPQPEHIEADILEHVEPVDAQEIDSEEEGEDAHLSLIDLDRDAHMAFLLESTEDQCFEASFAEFTNHNEGNSLYHKDKTIWVKMHGSENLQLAFEMRMKCDKGYIFERIAKEFPGFHVADDFGSHEVDTPDIGILRFLKSEAFTPVQRKVLASYHSRVCVALDEDGTAENPYIVIKNFLCHCDLFIRIKDLIELALRAGRL